MYRLIFLFKMNTTHLIGVVYLYVIIRALNILKFDSAKN